MKEYLLLFRGGDAERKQFSPQQMEAHMQRWTEWITGIAQSGKLVGAQPLMPEGRVLKGSSKKLTDGPFIEGKEILGGYVLAKAANFDEAVKISEGCPNLELESGTVEVRETGVMKEYY